MQEDSSRPIDYKDTLLIGRRVVDIDFFINQLKVISDHGQQFGCNLKNLIVKKERKMGLLSNITFFCNMCNITLVVDTIDSKKKDINYDSVLGTNIIGTGFLGVQELFAVMDIPTMSRTTYKDKQKKVGSDIMMISKKSMFDAVEEEKRIAIENGEVDRDGIPLITVIADGVWNKRSYRTNFSSLSGAAVIVGFYTQKVIFMNVRNKYCKSCVDNPEKEHDCNQDFKGSSTSMEADILVEGFMKSYTEQGCIYKYLIADGDSSVYKKILDARPYKNATVEKIECRNHLFRNFRNNFKKIIVDTSHKIGDRKIVGQRQERILYGIRTAIKYRKNESHSFNERVTQLSKDIENSVNHVFGDHVSCPEYFCSKKDERNYLQELAPKIKSEIKTLVNRLSRNSKSLIIDVDSNVAERFNSIVAKTVGGKRINFSTGQSYRYRCHVAVIQHNTERAGSTILKEIYPKSETKLLTNIETGRIAQNVKRKIRRSKEILVRNP